MPKQVIEDLGEVHALLARGLTGYLAMARDNEPYLVPLSYIYRDGSIFFHAALSGKKLDFIAANPRICFAVHEVDEVHQGDSACTSGIRYHSALAYGAARFIVDPEHKLEILQWLTDKYAPGRLVEAGKVATVAVVEMVVDRMTGKRNVAAGA
jgi:uncharacterized protein